MGKLTGYANLRYTLESFGRELSNAPTVWAASSSRVIARGGVVTVAAEDTSWDKKSRYLGN